MTSQSPHELVASADTIMDLFRRVPHMLGVSQSNQDGNHS